MLLTASQTFDAQAPDVGMALEDQTVQQLLIDIAFIKDKQPEFLALAGWSSVTVFQATFNLPKLLAEIDSGLTVLYDIKQSDIMQYKTI